MVEGGASETEETDQNFASPASFSSHPHMQRAFKADFYRGGTSRGVFFSAADLAPFDQAARDRILLTCLGSPDPNGRQIDGLGGGISSLSKAVIVGRPNQEWNQILSKCGQSFPGVPWADEVSKANHPDSGWDVIYRFAQVRFSRILKRKLDQDFPISSVSPFTHR